MRFSKRQQMYTKNTPLLNMEYNSFITWEDSTAIGKQFLPVGITSHEVQTIKKKCNRN